jgi:hypothetical protein
MGSEAMIGSCRSLLAGDEVDEASSLVPEPTRREASSPRGIACEQAPTGPDVRRMAFAIVLAIAPALAAENATSAIELWYGDEQRFGHAGNPQPRINLVGIVTNSDAVESLTVTVNDGRPLPLSLGPNGFRLSQRGAFNAEIERTDLRPGENTVVFTAHQRFAVQPVTKPVRVHYTAGRARPLPCSIKWSQVKRIDEVAEVMDGHWRLTPDGIRTLDPYYDRVISIGDTDWTDYEVLTSVIFHRMLAPVIAPKGPPYSNHGHASVLLRWQGHPDDGRQPRRKWHPCGGLAMWRADAGSEGNYWAWQGGETGIIARQPTKRVLELGRRYLIRARVETLPGPKTRYSVKGWDTRQPEPKAWDLVATDGPQDVQSGSLLLVAHHSDVTFGDVEVKAVR